MARIAAPGADNKEVTAKLAGIFAACWHSLPLGFSENRIPFDPFKDSFPSALSISLFYPFERGAAPPAQNGRLIPFEPFERLGRRAGSRRRRHVTARISASHSFTSYWNPGLRNENSLEIILGPIWPAVPRTAALQGDRSARDKG